MSSVQSGATDRPSNRDAELLPRVPPLQLSNACLCVPRRCAWQASENSAHYGQSGPSVLLCGFQVDQQFEFGRLLDREIGWMIPVRGRS
jgi:hypothetical protein